MNEMMLLMNETNTILKGHFKLTSGKCSEVYLEKFRLLEDPKILNKIGKLFYNELKFLSPDIILGAAVGGILLSSVVAKQFGTKGIFAERFEGEMILKRDFDIIKNSKVLIVEDIVTTGGSIDELIKIVQNKNAICIGITCLVDRSKNGLDHFKYPFYPLMRYPSITWKPNDCPMCDENNPCKPRGRTGK
mgnify:CR=1 FL=1|tara:strand:+ start:452 stop:1021 length:570 start_codon:yes stop_codon:yes gene_type:complete